MEPKNTIEIEKQVHDSAVDNALTVVELEERFELTVAAAEASRCTISDVSL
jgi:hypothetical protein